jgi:hypothetical protein
LRRHDFRLRVNRKRLSGRASPDREKQFSKINALRSAFLSRGAPVISVDAKKRELVGEFKNAGRTWRRTPRDVNMYDFPSAAKGVAIPYGIYDVGQKNGFVVVGTSHNTPAFAGNAICQWWNHQGVQSYPDATEVLILADGGSSNGAKVMGWKFALQGFADHSGLRLRIAHYPPGASKWNPVEHRLFGPISTTWAGEPLTDYTVIKQLIGSTRTPSGACCRVRVDRRFWPTQAELKKTRAKPAPRPKLRLRPARCLPILNYTISPSPIRAD